MLDQERKDLAELRDELRQTADQAERLERSVIRLFTIVYDVAPEGAPIRRNARRKP